MTSPRLDPPFWRHDAYTLARLAGALREVVAGLGERLRAGQRVVDLGAGDAPYRPLFAASGAVYTACDFGTAADVTLVPGEPVPLGDACADVVVSFQVLEHVWDLDAYLGEARRLLRDDGRLVLSTHGTWPYHPHPTDFRRWTRDGLLAELRTRGFEVLSARALLGPLAWTTQFRALGYHALLSRLPLLGPLLSAAVCAFMHLRMRLEDAITPAAWIDANAAIYLLVAAKAPATAAPTGATAPR